MQADPGWIACARVYTCEYCLSRQRCKSVRVASLPRATSFNQVLDIDVFHFAVTFVYIGNLVFRLAHNVVFGCVAPRAHVRPHPCVYLPRSRALHTSSGSRRRRRLTTAKGVARRRISCPVRALGRLKP